MKRVVIVFTAAGLMAGCSSKPSADSASAASKAASPQSVTVVAVESHELHSSVTLPAQLLPYETVDVFPKVTGFIETITVDRGSHVRAGEVIAKLSAPELVAQRSQAEARMRAAQSQVTAAQAKLASDQGTYTHLAAAAKTPGVVAGNDLAIAEQLTAADRAQVDASNNTVRAAQDELRGITAMQGYLEVRAPFDGVVTQRNLHPGALVGPSSGSAGAQPLVQIQSVNRLRLVIPVPESYAGVVTEGKQVSFTVPAFPDRSFKAPIARVSHNLNQNTRSMAVELDVKNSDGALTPGAFANVEWPVERSHATMTVPASAITTDLQRTFVIRVAQGKTEWVDVKTGVTVNGKTEVFGNLQPGDKVVVGATDAIRPGTAVTMQGM